MLVVIKLWFSLIYQVKIQSNTLIWPAIYQNSCTASIFGGLPVHSHSPGTKLKGTDIVLGNNKVTWAENCNDRCVGVQYNKHIICVGYDNKAGLKIRGWDPLYDMRTSSARNRYLRHGQVTTSHSILWGVMTYLCPRYPLLALNCLYMTLCVSLLGLKWQWHHR